MPVQQQWASQVPCDITLYRAKGGYRLFLNGTEVGNLTAMSLDQETFGPNRLRLDLVPTSITYVDGDPPHGRPELSDPDVTVDIVRAIENVKRRQGQA